MPLIHVLISFRQEFATLVKPDSKEDIAVSLLSDGFAMVEKRKEKRLQKLISTYKKAQEQAKANRVFMLLKLYI